MMEAQNLPWWGYPNNNPYYEGAISEEMDWADVDFLGNDMVKWAFASFLRGHIVKPLNEKAQHEMDSMDAIISLHGPFPHDPADLSEEDRQTCQDVFSSLCTEEGDVAAQFYGFVGLPKRKLAYIRVVQEAAAKGLEWSLRRANVELWECMEA